MISYVDNTLVRDCVNVDAVTIIMTKYCNFLRQHVVTVRRFEKIIIFRHFLDLKY